MSSPEVLLSAEQIARRTAELSQQITHDYRGSDLVIVGVLNGAFIFVADLVRQIELPTTVDFLRVCSYGEATSSSGVVQIRKDIDVSVEGRDLLLVEDIVDTGLTASFLVRHFELTNPKTLRVCTLLDKKCRRQVSFDADYVGFEIGDDFVVGYGLDFNERYRNLPDICVLSG